MTEIDLRAFGYAPGNYWFVCGECGNKQAVGAKRSTRCDSCAHSAYLIKQEAGTTRPAAPVNGLTVAFYQVFLQGDWLDCPLSAYSIYTANGERTRKLCDHSQAETIIEAKDDLIAKQQKLLDHAAEAKILQEADNEALTARVKELEAYVKREAQSSPHNAKDCLDEQLCAEALGTQLAALKDAAKSVEDWWINEGMNHFPGAPYCIFAIRAALEAKP
ncbi:hypothetical protein [Brucella pseudogrignonensis]|uniref:Uncharacterized protein n=1 Tax=Brucella pseudogrignonensis TaxID=419475 RepID=A0ABU1M7H8_9HYPH|nr:hypothetical protein [Brucella pseudogrignonensis]MDR6431980.1 hypothetical protein [Brucella pseudogrignonensis]